MRGDILKVWRKKMGEAKKRKDENGEYLYFKGDGYKKRQGGVIEFNFFRKAKIAVKNFRKYGLKLKKKENEKTINTGN